MVDSTPNKKPLKKLNLQNQFSIFLLHTSPNGEVKVELFFHNENVWLTKHQIILLFDVQRPAIAKHLKNISESGELQKKELNSILEQPTEHGAINGKKQTTIAAFDKVIKG